ncbi:hypothetical protein [Acidovorax sp. CF316]|uniref:hypothetical protein n=1 Tax=Acidovorax sp. CF316 TaxID=1144317 RepID=UPI0011B1F251|nr:hypothetical protein [Acidovorax sp. CF316]
MKSFSRTLALFLACFAVQSLQARPATEVETKAAYCEALLKPQIEMHRLLPADAKDAAMDAQNARAVANLKRISAYLSPRRSAIDAPTFSQADERYKADIRESTQVAKACNKKCMAEVTADPSLLKSRSCRKPQNCPNPAEDRINECSTADWIPN